MKSKDKDTGYTVNQIETSIPNQNNFLFNKLQDVDVIVNDTLLSATLDSSANSVIVNKKYFSEEKRIHSHIVLKNDIIIPATDEKEAYKKLARVLETDENIRNIKKRLPSSKTSEFILNNNVLFKISEIQELLVIPEMMQVNVIKKVHSFRHFAVTKTEELMRRDYCFPNMRNCVENIMKNCVQCKLTNKGMQEENGRTYHRERKKKKKQYQKGELVATLRTQFGNEMKPWTLH
ncbi:blastopia polyprotein [Trichonephila clavipes]|nr:blastopia polyprotein [Trichonephila clavipes]